MLTSVLLVACCGDDGTEGVVGTGLAAGHKAQATAVVGAGAAARAAAAAANQGEGKRQGQGDDARDWRRASSCSFSR